MADTRDAVTLWLPVVATVARCTFILIIRFIRGIAGPGLSRHGNAVRADRSGNGGNGLCKVTSW